jgi:CubicO group peptidase (beta-lactamase class C family)
MVIPMLKRTLLIFFVLTLVGCAVSEEPPTATAEPSPEPSPTEELMDLKVLDGILSDISSGLYGQIDQILLIRQGQVILDQSFQNDYPSLNAGVDSPPGPYNYNDTAWHPYHQSGKLHTLQSVTKSITGLVVGIAIQRGELPGPEVLIMDYFSEYLIDDQDESKGTITLRDLLTMQSGLFWDEWTYPIGDPRNSITQMESSEDWIQYTLDLPMQYSPGKVWVYNSGASQLLSVIIKESTGLQIDEYAEAYLFSPLGIEEYYWKKTPGGWPDTEGGLYLKAEDLARIGMLVLNQGEWDGQQVVDKSWIEAMTSPQVPDVAPYDPYWNYGYGYLWWLLPTQDQGELDVIGALGYGGQFLFIVPELDLVAVFYGWNIYQTSSSLIREAFLNEIIPAVR